MNRIIRIVGEYYGIDESLIMMKNKKEDIVKARQIAQYLIYTTTVPSYSAIAVRFKRTHGAVMNSVKKIAFFEEAYEDWRMEIKELRRRITNEDDKYENSNIVEELLKTFIIEHVEQFSNTDISEGDMKVLGDRLRLGGELITETIMKIREKRKQKLREEEDLLKKQHEDQLNKKKEPLHTPSDEQDTFGI